MKLAGQFPSAELGTSDDASMVDFDYHGRLQTTNAALKIALVAVSAVCCVLAATTFMATKAAANPRIYPIRINEIGRAEAISYNPGSEYKPQAPEVKYFLTQFTHNYFARVHATITRDYVLSLWFLDQGLFQQINDRDQKTNWLAKFQSGTDDNAEVIVRNVAIENLDAEPYRARVDFEKVYTTTAGIEIRREQWTANVTFRINRKVSNEAIPYNPLGLAITYFRADQAFESRP